MKTIYRYQKNYRYPHLYREDLEEIQNCIKLLQPRFFSITGDGFETEDVSEIPLDKDTRALTISGSPLYFTISRWGASLTNSDDGLMAHGAVDKINSILKKRENFLGFYFKKTSFLLVVFCGVINYVLISTTLSSISTIIYGLCSLILFFCFTYYNFFAVPKVDFDYFKNRKQNFFQKNRKDIINQIIGGIGVVILVALFKLFF